MKYFIKHPEQLKIMVKIIKQKHPVTPRVIEHLITNYAKQYHIVLQNNFILKHQYKLHLPKTRIDPNRRGERVSFEYEGSMVETTIPQITCFHWICSTPIYKYALENYKVIIKDLNVRKDLLPRKKDTSHIKIPIVEHAGYVCVIRKSDSAMIQSEDYNDYEPL